MSPDISPERKLAAIRTQVIRIAPMGLFVAVGIGGWLLADSESLRVRRNLQAIEEGQGFDKKEIDIGTYRIYIRAPQRDGRLGEMVEVGDRALGNALRSIREDTGCEINNVSKIDREEFPQFGTFVVTTRCR